LLKLEDRLGRRPAKRSALGHLQLDHAAEHNQQEKREDHQARPQTNPRIDHGRRAALLPLNLIPIDGLIE